MNEYWNAFQDITLSSELLLTDQNNSLEIQQAAISLNKSIQPCIEEIRQSATKLKTLIEQCSDDLSHAEDVWNSKPKIAEAAKEEIWIQIGAISGCSVRISHLASKCQDEAIKLAIKDWEEQIESLTKKWFIDSKGQSRKGIGFSDKDGFLEELNKKLKLQYQAMCQILKEGLGVVYQEISSIQLEAIQHCVNLLDEQNKNRYSKQIDLLVRQLETNFSNPTEPLPAYLIAFNTSVNADVKFMKDKGWEIFREDVVNFKDTVAAKIEKFITAIFDNRVELATQVLKTAIAFYNEFLERQNRYQQETPEQRQAEKAWIDQQHQELVQVKIGLEAILKDSLSESKES
jgi:hypothetical protein